jgi:hypothetical protein
VDFRIPGVGVKGRQNQQYRDQKRNRRYDESRSFYGDSRIVRFHFYSPIPSFFACLFQIRFYVVLDHSFTIFKYQPVIL